MNTTTKVAACAYCGRDLTRIYSAVGGFRVMCDPEQGGCGAESNTGATEALAVAEWNRCPTPAARALVAAAARRAMA